MSERFTRIINKMKADLKYYSEQDGAKIALVKQKEYLINELIANENANEHYSNRLNEELHAVAMKHEHLKEHIFMLEAILLIHGVDDFPAWFAKGKKYLFNQVMYNQHTGYAQLPSKIRRSLTEKEKELLFQTRHQNTFR